MNILRFDSLVHTLKPGLHYSKIFGTARVKLARVPKKSSANFVYTTPFLPYQNTIQKFLGPGKFSCRHAQFNYNQERLRDFGV